ncbi:flavin-containing monooxygenase [Rhodococcus sp. NPDC058514]|uniref:flavin-containing monooxygenase n=1 Tax=unclassified Rhodococcus (in: high G+C Gram-positive bacteria) TaxID=192944 RepID=UPI003649A8A4
MTQAGTVRDGVRHTRVLVIGAGFAGLGMAIGLTRAGHDDFIVLEKGEDVGGTWRENTYPGCECDVPSALYSYSFEQQAWSGLRASQPEILRYLRRVSAKYRVRDKIEFGAEVERGHWDDVDGRWHLFTTGGHEFVAQFLVVGTGALHLPKVPTIPGAASFEGAAFHSARWDHAVDLAGKRVAVIGTGASAVQLVPELAAMAHSVQLYQRTPPWVLPRRDSLPGWRQAARLPPVRLIARTLTYWAFELRALGLNGRTALTRRLERRAMRHLRRQIQDPALREALTPTYRIGCKRILRSNEYYPVLNSPTTEVITERVAEIGPDVIVAADGTRREADVIVYATGFRVAGSLARLPLVGRDGVSLQERWQRDGIAAHLGISVSGLPNAFFLTGPNTGLGHNSVVFMIEAQVRYALRAMELVDREAATALEVRPDVQDAFRRDLHARLAGGVWSTGGCRSWYVDARGVNNSVWPGFSWQYWLRTRRVNRGDHEVLTHAAG